MTDAQPPMTDEQLRAVTIGEPQVLTGPIRIVEYDPAWPRRFAHEAELIRGVLGRRALRVEHTGSTSVPGLAAKPVIDIVLVVADTVDEAAYVPPLESAGYALWIREPGWFQHRLLIRRDPDVNLHVFPERCSEVERMIRFRDRLREHDGDRTLYAAAKRDLARRRWKYMQHYADAKTAVIAEILSRAT